VPSVVIGSDSGEAGIAGLGAGCGRSVAAAQDALAALATSGGPGGATPNADYAHASIPTSELHWIPDGSHFGFWVNVEAETHQRYVLDWLLAHRNR
jgi:hypothetical protein